MSFFRFASIIFPKWHRTGLPTLSLWMSDSEKKINPKKYIYMTIANLQHRIDDVNQLRDLMNCILYQIPYHNIW